MDLLEYRKLYKHIDRIPLGIHALSPAHYNAAQGVIFLLRNKAEDTKPSAKNMIHPYYLVYVDKNGEIVCPHTSPRKNLELMRQLCKGRTEPVGPLCEHFNLQTKQGRKMKVFARMLDMAIASTSNFGREAIEETVDLGSIADAMQFLEGFELVSFLVVL